MINTVSFNTGLIVIGLAAIIIGLVVIFVEKAR